MSEVQASVQGSSAMIDQRSLLELCQIEEAPMEQEHYQETWMTAIDLLIKTGHRSQKQLPLRFLNPFRPDIHIQILHTDLHLFPKN